MYKANMTIHLGFLCGDAVTSIKAAAFKWNISCQHQKGPGWLSANHYFKFEHDNEVYLKLFIEVIREWVKLNQ